MAARKRHTDTVETLRDFFTYYLYHPTIDRDRYEIIPRGRHRARGCVGLPSSLPFHFPSFHAPRPAGPGVGCRGRDVAYVSTHVFPAALRCDMDYAMVLRRRIPPRGEIRIRRSRDTRYVRLEWSREESSARGF